MRVLITGYGGFVGRHLARHLDDATDWEVWGTILPAASPSGRDPGPLTSERVLPADLRAPDAVRRALDDAAPDVVVHLAGQSFVPDAWRDPWGTFETNVRIQINLLEAAVRRRDAGAPLRLVAVTSNEVYGAVPPERLPVDETAPLAPANPYAASKAAQDLVAGQFARSHGLDVIRARPFNHFGPGQSDRFVASSFARQVAEIEAGRRPPVLRVGDLTAERDFTDVRDIARAYRRLAEDGRPGDVYNLGSGVARPVRALLDGLLARATCAVRVEPDPERMRPSDIPRTQCDARKAQRELGWAPEIPFERTLADLLDDWRRRVAAAPATTG